MRPCALGRSYEFVFAIASSLWYYYITMTDEAQIKITIEVEIPKDDYATLTKWLKYYGAENTVQNTLEHGARMSVTKWLPKAKRHLETGKNALERFRDTLFKGEDDG